MSRYKYLANNIVLFTISNFVSKILIFLLIPLYARILTPLQYGVIDIIQTTVNLAFPIFTISLSESIIRYLLEKNSNKESILKASASIFLKGNILVIAVALLSLFFNISLKYVIIFIVFYFFYSLYNLLLSFSRGIEKIKLMVGTSILNVIILIFLNLVLLVKLKMGLEGYFISLIIANFITSIILIVGIKPRKVFKLEKNKDIEKENKDIEKEMIRYGKPLVFNSIGWWISSASDRYVVTFFCGAAINGLYSMAYKIPTILTVVQNIFIQAWQITALKEYKKEDAKKLFSKVYEYYNFILIAITSIILLVLKLASKIVFGIEFFEAWKYVPFLLLSVIFGALSGFIGTIFCAEKDSKIYSISTIIGAIINIVMNLILVPFIGAMGAAFATCISYIVIHIIRCQLVKKYMILDINRKVTISNYIIVMFQSLVLIFNIKYQFYINILAIVMICVINNKKIEEVITKLWKIKKSQNILKK